GQHDAAEFEPLLARIEDGFEMAIGARDSGSHANVGRLYANGIYNVVASWLTGRRIPDLTSGFRVARAALFKQFLYLLPNGFSYPTTITMAFLRSGYPICFEPIPVGKRIGKSHIRPIRDGVRFMVIIFKIATLYAPLKIFLPISALFFTTGAGWYAYSFATMGRFTNMSMLLFSASVIVFLIGLISEQITALTFSKS
ncbi:MAG TPA: glycosyltransferase family 2 protein, partial [Woeseiaceae bacterium]|nr:glycosyltransferase family 2 protein [Woeseiaceae bacterium]